MFRYCFKDLPSRLGILSYSFETFALRKKISPRNLKTAGPFWHPEQMVKQRKQSFCDDPKPKKMRKRKTEICATYPCWFRFVTAAKVSALHGEVEIARVLLTAKADANMASQEGSTFLGKGNV